MDWTGACAMVGARCCKHKLVGSSQTLKQMQYLTHLHFKWGSELGPRTIGVAEYIKIKIIHTR